MDWDSLAGFALLLTIAIVLLRLLWYWPIILLVLGPSTYAGVVAGHVGAGLLAAAIVSGCLIETARYSSRRGR